MFGLNGSKSCSKISRLAVTVLVCILIIFTSGCQASNTSINQNQQENTPIVRSWDHRPAMEIDPSNSYIAKVQTSKGSFEIELFAEDAPETVNNFVFLAKNRYYEGLPFHRIIETFMIQTGDPNGDGTGGPGYTIPDELNSNREYEPGIVAMAKSMEPDSAGSQFFICTGTAASSLNLHPYYPIFGKVISGMNIVEKIAKTPVENHELTGEHSKPTEVVKIEKIDIREG